VVKEEKSENENTPPNKDGHDMTVSPTMGDIPGHQLQIRQKKNIEQNKPNQVDIFQNIEKPPLLSGTPKSQA